MKESYRQSFVLVSSTVINSLLGLAFYVLVARSLAVSQFGYFSYLLGLGLVTAELADFGLGAAIVKFGSRTKFPAIFSLVLAVRLASFLVIGLTFFLGTVFIDRLLLYSGAVGIAILLSYLSSQSLLARQKYVWQAAANIFGNFSRLAIIATLHIFNLLTPVSALVAFCLGAGLTFFIGAIPLLLEFSILLLRLPKFDRTAVDIFRFSIPLAGSFSLASLAGKVDVPIVYFLSGPVAAGIYASAQKLVSVFPQMTAALEGVFAPKFSTGKSFWKLFRDYLTLATFSAAIVAVVIPVGGSLVPLIFGQKYLLSAVIFQILLLGVIFLFLSGPFAAAMLYWRAKPVISLGINAATFLVSLGLYFLLVPSYGEIGAALTSTFVNFAGLCLYVVMWRRL